MNQYQLFIGALDLSRWIVEKKTRYLYFVDMPTETLKALMLIFPQHKRVFGNHPRVCIVDSCEKNPYIIAGFTNYGAFEGTSLGCTFWFAITGDYDYSVFHLRFMNAHQWKTFNLFSGDIQTEDLHV